MKVTPFINTTGPQLTHQFNFGAPREILSMRLWSVSIPYETSLGMGVLGSPTRGDAALPSQMGP